MPYTRSTGRNVFLHSAQDRERVLGGLCLIETSPAPATRKAFLHMVGILVLCQVHFTVHDAHGTPVPHDSRPLLPGHYYVVPDDPNADIRLNDEPIVTRSISLDTGTRVRDFSRAVRDRDQQCVVTREQVIANDYTGFQAAHIFPLSHQQLWNQNHLGRWISFLPEHGGAINSVQNGLLMSAGMHILFDDYAFSINPDDNYTIFWFRKRGKYGHAEGVLPERTLQDHRRPAKELLRWHFRQAVLANMRGEGEPSYEYDFPPGSDMLEDIRTGPKPAERMEAELFGRVALDMDLDDLDKDLAESSVGNEDKEAESKVNRGRENGRPC